MNTPIIKPNPEASVFDFLHAERSEMILKRLIIAIALALLVVPVTFAGEQPLLARVTVYWAARGDAGSNRSQSTGRRLQTGDCSVDTRHIAYGSSVIFPDGTTSAAVDTGPAVRNRKAARISGRTVYERNAIVIDRFFETKREALSWASRSPLFMTVRVVPPNLRTLAQLPEEPPLDSLAQPAF